MKYEAHVTVEPIGHITFAQFASDAKEIGWSASKFEHDDVDGIAGKWFISYASDDRADIVGQLKAVVANLGRSFTVLRWKLERTMYDSKDGADIDAVDPGLPRLSAVARADKPLAVTPINEVGDLAVEALEQLGLKYPCIMMVVVAPESEEIALTTNVSDPTFPSQAAAYILQQHTAGETVQ